VTEELRDVPAPSALPIAPGQIIGERYLVGEVLGGGGVGVVCAGTHVHLGTPVAIKLIHSELKDDDEAVQRFVNEARATAALKGEHIARVFDVGLLPSGEPYLVMEHLEGIGLDQYLHERGPLAQTEAIDIMLQVCEGLAEAHATALVHRDVKPANLFLARRPDGQYSVKILDFGIAKRRVEAESPALTDPGKSLGSPWYMSPEQMLTPASVDERADVWSLGVLLFELLTARRPFDGESVPQVCANVLTTLPPRPSDLRGDLAPELDEIVLCCLEKDAQRRLRSVSELAAALQPFASVMSGAGVALDDRRTPNAEPFVYESRRPPSYGSLTPLHTGLRDSSPHLPPRRRSTSLILPLVAVGLLLFGGWLQYRDPSLVPRATRAVGAARVVLPWDPKPASGVPAAPLEPVSDPPTLLQTIHTARALPEVDRSDVATGEANEVLSPEQIRARVENYEAWLRAQGLKRLNDTDQ
jgi:serine/threonine-protein kinase